MSLPHISDASRRARLAHRHRLIATARSDVVETITDDLVALHSSDPATVFLSVGVRMASPLVSTIEKALYVDRSVLRHHAMRRTLWVMTPATAARAHGSSGRKVAATERRSLLKRLATAGEIDDPERWLDEAMAEMCRVVADRGPILTLDIGEILPHLRIPLAYPGPRKTTVEIMAHTKVIQLAGFEGRVVRTDPSGSWVGSQYRWAAMTDWISDGIDHLDTDVAADGLALHWLRRFGPGTAVDVQWWTGWTKTAVSKALARIEAQQVTLDSGEVGWVAPADTASDDDASGSQTGPWVALLPGLDPTAMGWKERAWYIDEDIAARVFDRNGNAGPTIWADGRIVGGWVQRSDGTIACEVQSELSSAHHHLLEAEIERLTEFMGDTRFKVRFPSPNQGDLLH